MVGAWEAMEGTAKFAKAASKFVAYCTMVIAGVTAAVHYITTRLNGS